MKMIVVGTPPLMHRIAHLLGVQKCCQHIDIIDDTWLEWRWVCETCGKVRASGRGMHMGPLR